MTVKASIIARFLQTGFNGEDLDIARAASLGGAGPGCLVFAKEYSEQAAVTLSRLEGVFALVGPEFAGKLSCAYAIVENPRLAFARAVTEYFDPRPPPIVARTAVVSPRAKLGARVAIGEYSVIGQDVEIGDDTVVRNHAVIAARTRIGARCLIKSHAVIGEEGFGFDFDAASDPVRIPHVGGVLIGDDVEIGACTVIARGTLDDTVIGDRAKIDDQVFIAHNVRIGRSTLVIAEAEISGSVTIGANVWIGPNATVINKASIGDRAFVGMGAVVTKDVAAGVSVAGNPARPLRQASE